MRHERDQVGARACVGRSPRRRRPCPRPTALQSRPSFPATQRGSRGPGPPARRHPAGGPAAPGSQRDRVPGAHARPGRHAEGGSAPPPPPRPQPAPAAVGQAARRSSHALRNAPRAGPAGSPAPRSRPPRGYSGATASARAREKTLPQCGRAANGSSAPRQRPPRAAPAPARAPVKWIATVSRPYCGLIHNMSAATVRISGPGAPAGPSRRGRGSPRSPRPRPRGPAGTPAGSPLPGAQSKPIRKCGSRSAHGPGMPSCGVQLTGSRPRIGWRSTVAAGAEEQLRQDLLGRVGHPALDPHLVGLPRPTG